MKCQDVSVDIKTLSPGGCLPLHRGYIMYKIIRFCIKSDFEDIFLKLVTNDRSGRMFLLTSKFCPQGFVGPGAIYMYKIMKKMCIKSDFKEMFLTCSN